MVIGSVRRERTLQRALTKDDDMIQTLAANGPNEPFDVGPGLGVQLHLMGSLRVEASG